MMHAVPVSANCAARTISKQSSFPPSWALSLSARGDGIILFAAWEGVEATLDFPYQECCGLPMGS